MMEQSIASLSPEQAQHALMIFYDLLPDDLWEGGKRPSAAELKFTAEQLQEDAPDDARPVVNALLDEGSEAGKGEAAKTVLGMLYEQESLRGFVEQAAQQAKQPHLAPIPLIIGAVIVLLAGVRVRVGPKGVDVQIAIPENVKAIVDGVKSLSKNLPDDVLQAIVKKFSPGD